MQNVCAYIGAVAAAVTLTAGPSLQADPVKIYIMAGQSNMVGAGTTSDLPTSPIDYQASQWVRFNYGLSVDPTASVSNGWETLRPSVRGDGFGPEITFGKRVDDDLGEIGLIKQAANGTSLFSDWDPDATNGPMLYQRLIDRVDSALGLLDEQAVAYEVVGFLWTQGEADASLSKAPDYQQALTDFIASARQDLGIPDLDFYISRLSSGTQFSGRDLIRQAQANIAKADPNVLAVNTDHLTLKNDRVHFTSSGVMGLGEAFADAVILGPPPGDFDQDGLIADNDLNHIITHWGQTTPDGDIDGDGLVGLSDMRQVADQIDLPAPLPGTGDFTLDGFVGLDDLDVILSQWGEDVLPGNLAEGDSTGDGFVGLGDLDILLEQWGTSPIDDRPPDPTPDDMDLDNDGDLDLNDIDVLVGLWSYRSELDPNLPVNSTESPGLGDFNSDGEIDVDDLRFMLAALPDTVAGDLDADGYVGLSDLDLVLNNWNTNTPPGDPAADANSDDYVGLDDLDVLLNNWNQGTPPAQTIPEPATACVFTAGLLGMVRTRRDRA